MLRCLPSLHLTSFILCLLADVSSVTARTDSGSDNDDPPPSGPSEAHSALWVTAPNIPEAAGRYELDDEYPPVRGHLTWVSTSFIGGIKTERRVALGSGCSGNVWLIGTTDAVEQDMGWIVTIDGGGGESPTEVLEWGRVMNKDWVKDGTVRVGTQAPQVPPHVFLKTPSMPHLESSCTLCPDIVQHKSPVWECGVEEGKERRWVFTDSHGNWVLGPDYRTDTGWTMAWHHGGRLPHQIVDWRRQDGKEGWVPDPTIRILSWDVDELEPSQCDRFWIEGISGLGNTPFIPSTTTHNGRSAYLTEDGETIVYWCPSSFGLAGRSSWKLAWAAELLQGDTTSADMQASYPNCPGFAVCEDLTDEPFLEMAVTSTWHAWEKVGSSYVWVKADVRITCFDDLL